jgi:dienelactone hydrolase
MSAPANAVRKEPVQFFSGPGHRLAGDLFWPAGAGEDGPPVPGVVVLHGFTAIKEFLVNVIAERFAAEGYAALCFDYRGYGQSEGPRHRLMPTEQVEDGRNALTFLATQPGVDPDRIGAVGVSYGGAIGLGVAAIDERLACLSCNGTISNGERWMRRIRREWEWIEFKDRVARDAQTRVRTGESERVSPWDILLKVPDPTNFIDKNEQTIPGFKSTLPLESAQAIIEFKPELDADRIRCPVRFIHAETDPLVPTEESISAYERCPDPKDLVLLPVPARMDLYQKHFDTTIDNHLDWHMRHNPVGASREEARA